MEFNLDCTNINRLVQTEIMIIIPCIKEYCDAVDQAQPQTHFKMFNCQSRHHNIFKLRNNKKSWCTII